VLKNDKALKSGCKEFKTLHKKWLPSSIFSPLPGRERVRGAQVLKILFFNSLLSGDYAANSDAARLAAPREAIWRSI
jgi:hypothetical protein